MRKIGIDWRRELGGESFNVFRDFPERFQVTLRVAGVEFAICDDAETFAQRFGKDVGSCWHAGKVHSNCAPVYSACVALFHLRERGF